MIQGIYDGTAAHASDTVSTTSGSFDTPAYLSDVYVSVANKAIRVMTTTSGSGGIAIAANTDRVFIGRFQASTTIEMRADGGGGGSATVTSSCVKVCRTR
jgi:hypothetical protein